MTNQANRTAAPELLAAPRALRMLALAGLVLAATACASNVASPDARFEAGWRPSKAYCLFGGETAQLDAYCARVNFGREGAEAIVRSVNEEILQHVAGQTLRCTDHVALAKEQMKRHKDYSMVELYSCDRDAPVENGQKICHVSLLVTDGVTGDRFVMDNGHVLNPQVYGGVAPYSQFARQVETAWTQDTPVAVELAGAAP